jgi:hypothetical protein
VLISIATAYALRYFSNILEYLQVLVFFFIVPLFGTVILGMLWKRATPAGGFWGFLAAIFVSIGMWVYVHTFPDGYRPQPKATLSEGAVVRLAQTTNGKTEKITQVVVENGAVSLVNVPVSLAPSQPAVEKGELAVTEAEVILPATYPQKDGAGVLQVLAPQVLVAGTQQQTKFGVEGIPVVLKRGVRIKAESICSRFAPAAFNPEHTKYIARSAKAKPMAVNMYSGWWSLVVCVLVTVLVSLFTKPKPEAELRNLVMGLTPLPDEGPAPWHQNPKLWAGVVAVALIAVNIIFW